MDVVDPDLKALYLKRRLLPHEAVRTIAGCKNLILGMSAAQPPALMAATADALKDRLIGPPALYYLHGTESLRTSLLVPELSDRVIPRPLFLSHADRDAIAHSGSRSWIEFVPAMLHQAGRLLTEHIDPECGFRVRFRNREGKKSLTLLPVPIYPLAVACSCTD